ncbi:hypothetical protein RHGRI_005342 [Rhododendron griersonianum]|uniref:Reverse transcriptase zinc-binding domain-containing protein n=1 Tax=Rhododendron griersonianum TaxID=479676 RepID=A0AAV6LBX5_9ERIC|nr:hypothetical protein RHGRI_005342 [Rhododendron griersonianum]
MQADSSCVLCHGGQESHFHLFFECPFSALVWLQVREKCEVPPLDWDLASEIQWGVFHCRTKSIQATTFKLCLLTSIYYLWRERNSKIFRQISSDSSSVVNLIMGEINECVCSWRRMVQSSKNSRFCAK